MEKPRQNNPVQTEGKKGPQNKAEGGTSAVRDHPAREDKPGPRGDRIRVTDTAGTLALCLLSLVLLLGLLAAHKRERKASQKQVEWLIKAKRG